MKKNTCRLLVLFCILVLLKTGIAFFVQSPSIFSDEYLYMKIARSFFYHHEFSVHQIQFHNYPPLYPTLLSVMYFFQEMHLIYFGMKFLNAIISSLIVIPLYLLARTLWDEKEAFLLTIVTSLFPGFFAFSPYIMAENLFYPLFLTTIYGVYKSITESKISWFILTGVSFIAAYMTRVIAIAVIPIFAVLIIQKWLRVKRRILLSATLLLGILLISGLIVGFTSDTLWRNIHFIRNIQVKDGIFFLIWIAGWITYVALSTGIIPLIALTAGWKDDKRRVWILIVIGLGVTLTGILALRAASGLIKIQNPIHLPGRPIGRYIDMLSPLVIILGLNMIKKIQKPVYFLWGGLFAVGSVIFFFPLSPANNTTLTLIGVFQYGMGLLNIPQGYRFFLGMIAILIMLTGWRLLQEKKEINVRFIFLGFLLFFILTNMLASGIEILSAKEWNKQEHVKLGEWLQKYNTDHARVVIDKKYCTAYDPRDTKSVCSPALHTSLLGVWLNSEIVVKEQKEVKAGDFFITKEETSFVLIRKTESGTYLYRKMFPQQP